MRNKYTKQFLAPVIAASKTWSEVCRTVGVKPATGLQTHIKRRAIEFGIDYSHFVGHASNKGRTFFSQRIPAERYLFEGSSIKSHTLKLRLWRDGIKPQHCEQCKVSKWGGEELPLELDHINRDNSDNRLENLMILCPNCHAVKTRKDRRS